MSQSQVVHLPAGFDEALARALVPLNPGTLFVLQPTPVPVAADAPPAPVDHHRETIAMVAGLLLNGLAGLVTGGAAPLVAIVAKAGAAGVEAWLTGTTKERHTTEEILAAGSAIPDPQT